MKCSRCGVEGITFGHQGLCANDYAKYMAHQKELRDISIENREMLAARLVHPAGRKPKHRDLWARPEFQGHVEEA